MIFRDGPQLTNAGSRRDLGQDQRYLIWKLAMEHSDQWRAKQQAIQDEANRKRSEAQKDIPKAEMERKATDSGSTSHSDPANKTSTAKAAASRTNRGAVERMDGLDAKRPDLAAKVRSLARAPFLGVNPHCPDDLVN